MAVLVSTPLPVELLPRLSVAMLAVLQAHDRAVPRAPSRDLQARRQRLSRSAIRLW